MWKSSVLISGILISQCLAASFTVDIQATPKHVMPSTLYGYMFEDINSGDGGLYAELLQNRAFQLVTPGSSAALSGWRTVGSGSISVIKETTPVSAALPNALSLTVPASATGGFANDGFFGIKVDSASTYTASFFYRFPTASSFSGPVTVSLQSKASGTVFATTSVNIVGSQTTWKQVTVTLKPTSSATDINNSFIISLGGSSQQQKVNFAMLSLFPPTFKNRANGLRNDIATALAGAGPAFFRFPGGNNLEGNSIATRWVWNDTVGPLVNRPGRQGTWGYTNTDGLGLKEYLDWIEDAGMESIMAVWAGYALDHTSVPEAGLQPYIQSAIDQVNFVVGDPSQSAAAALRSSLGHPAPYKLRFVEIGNEDNIGTGPQTYGYRWHDIVSALQAQFPTITFISTAGTGSLSPKPKAADNHVYQTPSWFASNSFQYDSVARDGTLYFEGEYAAISTNASDIFGSISDGRLAFPTMQGSAGEAAFMTGLERNGDIVFAASYAPLMQHISSTQWTPDLITYDAGNLVLSTSFHVQKLFMQNRGDVYLPSTLPTASGTVFWSVTRRNSTTETLIKVVNTASDTATVTFNLPFNNVATSGTVTTITGAQTASNTLQSPNVVTPKTSTITTGKTFTFTAPGFSVHAINVKAS